ncbi:exocyst complex component Sec3-domain-containing protein [Emericellopsis atlantica]|uniref:Exocyst complex component Sec3-domain-containing protein n=1 Tax=Emericellopsis atlantica TaxID=2614577 RepID=A0A9P7ZSD8_9HYPO|nr:exocyst complex component Sec3-domain-containing protein [Emericellopsis atlantica]KAG9256820.1 exocyst complex component Sec3-domain-containing protein [Emericellopsis atlantica]
MDRGNGAGPPGGPSRAERFEDEKRRIIETCFNKKDPDGSLQETYITHIRIVEFSSHPASPPPANARAPEAEKPRVIIIAVRKSGRVRMHKSKENPNGTYSIGKTWNLDDLTRIESYTAPNVPWEHRESAGETGFLVSLGKPYFWQAQSDKEKKFFIASMIKIYGKYTSGKVPELVGFDQKELDQVLGAGKRYPPPLQRQQTNQTWSASSVATAVAPPSLQRQQSNQTFASSAATIAPDASSPVPSALTPGQPTSQPPSQGQPRSRSRSRGPSPGRGPPPSIAGEPPSRPQQWTPPIRNPAGGDGSPAGSIDSTTSRERPGIRHGNPNSRSQESVARSFVTTRSEDVPSIPPRSRNGIQGPGASGRFGDPSEPPTQPLPTPPQQGQGPSQPRSQSSLAGSRPRTPREEQPSAPERRRPPMDPTRPQDRDLVPPPLSAKRDVAGRESPARDTPPRASTPKDPVAPPPRSSERMSPRKDSLSYRPGTATSLASTIQDRSTPPPSFSPAPKAESPRPREPVASPPAPVTSPEPEGENPVKTEASAPSTPLSEPMSPPEPPPVPEEEARPGLGPMIKAKRSKGEIAGAFRKAASAAAMANAFKPRPGGAGERLRQAAQQMQNKTSDEPDGITGVVPAPPKPVVERPKSRTEREATPEPVPPPRAPQRTSKVPEVKISVPTSSSRPPSQQGPGKEQPKEAVAVLEPQPPKPPPRKSLVARQDAKYLQSLGIDPIVLDGRSEEFGTWLDHFGWIPGQQMQSCNMEEMQFDLEREINKAQAGGWLARFQDEDDRVDAIKLGIDVAISECEELDNLLTLYSVELSTLSEDIAYIEAQGQGLQVQTANQKLLKKELESLLETCAITSTDLDPLRLAPIDHLRGLEDVEQALVTLYRAMAKMDGAHSLKASPTTAPDGSGLKSDFGDMRIVQEKKEMYIQESSSFIRRLLEFMPQQYDQAFAETKRAMEGALSKKADVAHHDAGRDMLWRYNPLMLYTRFAERGSWDALIAMYQEKGAPIYKNEFLTVIMSWKKNARKITGGEAELLFTSQSEKQQENVATAARKATVKRSQTLARAWRSPLADGNSKGERDKAANDGRSFPYEVFAGVLDDLLPLVEMEQNFIIDFFHATTLEQSDFPDCVAAVKPRDRRGGDLRRHRLMEPDRDLAKRVTRAMDVMFAFLDSEFTRLMEWVIGQDPMYVQRMLHIDLH